MYPILNAFKLFLRKVWLLWVSAFNLHDPFFFFSIGRVESKWLVFQTLVQPKSESENLPATSLIRSVSHCYNGPDKVTRARARPWTRSLNQSIEWLPVSSKGQAIPRCPVISSRLPRKKASAQNPIPKPHWCLLKRKADSISIPKPSNDGLDLAQIRAFVIESLTFDGMLLASSFDRWVFSSNLLT